MKLLKNKGFLSIVITKKNIILFLCIIFLLTVLITSFFKKDEKTLNNQYTSSDDFHGMLLSSHLNSDFDYKKIVNKFVSAIVGFDIKKPQTIILSYSEDADKTNLYQDQSKVNQPTPTTPPPPTQEPTQNVKIQEETISKGMSISNATGISVNLNELITRPLLYTLKKKSFEILIVHTHTTESYTPDDLSSFSGEDTNRSTDEEKNITAVGEVLYNTLTEHGIKVIHDKTVHDYPSYSGAYNRSKATTLKNLEKYPDLKIVLDVHRDGIVRSDGTKVKVCSDINGEKVAQCMFVVGSDSELTHDLWIENLTLATKLQNKANELYPGLMRPINFRNERFNQQLSTGSIIIEVGSNGNTLDEAKKGAKLMANVIASLFEG